MKATYTPDNLTYGSLIELTSFKGKPCLSLYQPTHRRHPENQQDPIRFRHLVKALEVSLLKQYPSANVKSILELFEDIAENQDFWKHTLDGLAILSAPKLFRVFLLQRTVAEFSVVSNSFHTKPLRQLLQSAERYQVLALSMDKVELFEGDRNALNPVELEANVPQTMAAALGEELTDSHSSVSSYGGVGSSHMAMHHGQGGRKDEIDSDTKRFFRAVDRAVLEHHSRPSGLPLMLAALPEHHHLFHEVSHNPFLMAKGLTINPQSLKQDALCKRAWEIAEPQQQARQEEWSDAYAAAAAKGLGSENMSQVAHAAVAGRVATLLIEAERQVAGSIDASTGRIDHSELSNPRIDDVLDDLGALVEKMGGKYTYCPPIACLVKRGWLQALGTEKGHSRYNSIVL